MVQLIRKVAVNLVEKCFFIGKLHMYHHGFEPTILPATHSYGRKKKKRTFSAKLVVFKLRSSRVESPENWFGGLHLQ